MPRSTLSFAAAASLLLALSLPAAAVEDLPFVGKWNCEVAEFTFTPTTYNNGSDDLPIQNVEKGADGVYTLSFADDYQIMLSGITETEMGWFSPASGDNFNCSRVEE